MPEGHRPYIRKDGFCRPLSTTTEKRGQVLQSNILPYNPSFEVPAADFKNWAGGFIDITAAN
jgi:hypothetical protein